VCVLVYVFFWGGVGGGMCVFVHKDDHTGKQTVKIGDLGVAKLLNSNSAFGM
jgi:hypothetical protein